MSYIGRFAPSPTGPLHIGSLMAAVASYIRAQQTRGQWLVRIEDLDPPREVKGAADSILRTLDRLGFTWDQEVVYQSRRTDYYQEALDCLAQQELLYPCVCSRKIIVETGQRTRFGIRYPGTCRHRPLAIKRQHALRVRVPDDNIRFTDYLQGEQQQQLQQDIGDFIVKRADNMIAYQLAVVVDDAAQDITEVVRGCDLLDSTPRQIWLQQVLGYTTPDYFHIPVIVNHQGEKLSKQTYARPIDKLKAGNALFHAFLYLGQQPPDQLRHAGVADCWQWLNEHWNPTTIQHTHSIDETGDLHADN